MSAEQAQLIAALYQENVALQKQVILCFAATLAERERILDILRAVSPNAGYYCKLLLSELVAAIEEGSE